MKWGACYPLLCFSLGCAALQINPEYVKGPYYKNSRYARGGTPFANLPDMVPEVGNVFGMWMASMPPNSRSFYDSFGSSVASCIRWTMSPKPQTLPESKRYDLDPRSIVSKSIINHSSFRKGMLLPSTLNPKPETPGTTSGGYASSLNTQS